MALWGGLRHHVEYIRKKDFNRINILKALSQTSYGAHSHHLLTLVFASIRSLTDYGAAILSSASAALMSKLEVLHTGALRVALGLPRWVPNLVLRQHVGSQLLASRFQDLEVRFWIKHISRDGWSPLCDYVHSTDKTNPLGMVSMGSSIAELLDEIDGHFDHLLQFQAPEPFSPWLVYFHLSDLPFQRLDLNGAEIAYLFGEYLTSITDRYTIIATDASKSSEIASIAGCSSHFCFGY